MSTQLTLQTPLQLPPSEIPSYLDQLWNKGDFNKGGANTFCLLIWQPAWIEQELIRTGELKSPLIGSQRKEVINSAREVILKGNLPHSTPPLDEKVAISLSKKPSKVEVEDLRGQHVDVDISALNPRRLITLAPTLEENAPLEALVAAYCPLYEESNTNTACGDVVVLRGGKNSLTNNLSILEDLLPEELPSWVWWNGSINEASGLLTQLAESNRRLIIDTSIGEPKKCLELLLSKISSKQAINDLNWLRLRTWRETLAMVFDPPHRREILNNITTIDIDIEGNHQVQGLLLAAWIADKLKWKVNGAKKAKGENLTAEFIRDDNQKVNLNIVSLPVGQPSIHPGQIVGLRLICKPIDKPEEAFCVILASESGECMRLEAGGMSNMHLIEEVVPVQNNSLEKDVARLLSSSRGSTSPLLEAATPIAHKLLSLAES